MPAGAPAEQRRRLRHRVRRQRRHEPVEAPQRLLGVRGAERRQRACGVRGLGSGVRVSKISKIGKILQLIFFANFWRARSRLYQNEILQENMRLTAFFKLYKICILLHRCNLKFFAKNRFEKLRIRKISENFANFATFAIFLLNFNFYKNC